MRSGVPTYQHEMAMEYVNEGAWDRLLRISVGAALIFLGWWEVFPGLWSAAARVFGFIPLLTGLLGWSPLYAILGVSTRRAFRPRGGGSH